ncbi:B3/B4 domain-containing protein (DNA/RNA-binding domain of Phe-tRNA-synthetase) [Paraoerskovia marina]|uniref:B3/B4 domain-containing protein (DNA/RNA-binding domain of Phe-tRNA-synthetase) n=1 Tax=Paraoerskovia marina TaxID=545619 RepID=A0A1H1T1C8_9CELL|nr:phenylalanine--tRNA ligase beta subunit-related protein [Paraoerskovia marina]SDS53766.1 B3/B4 domain-containing protein (DNA/RNA-binding domain of Phe-tRNA-synthetase) [Paraoerskovia marina]
MPESTAAEAFLNACTVEVDVFALRPDYRALLLVADGLAPAAWGEGDDVVDGLIAGAEAHARDLLAESPAEELPGIASWRDAYRAFGAKPQRTRNSLEALTRRAVNGLPRVNALTDIYNSISVLHQIPLGGEDLDRYDGPARLIRAIGDEVFGTSANGEAAIEHPEPGEVVWCDAAGVTCRRWNWRQGHRTALTDTTCNALFILDALAPVADDELHAAGDALEEALTSLGENVQVSRRLVTP